MMKCADCNAQAVLRRSPDNTRWQCSACYDRERSEIAAAQFTKRIGERCKWLRFTGRFGEAQNVTVTITGYTAGWALVTDEAGHKHRVRWHNLTRIP